MNLILGYAGLASSGKDTTHNIIQQMLAKGHATETVESNLTTIKIKPYKLE